MATFTLIAGATNLAAGASYVGGVAPAHATADSIRVPAGNWTIPSVNIASALSITSLTDIFFDDGFTGSWGDASGPMLCPVSGGIYWNGSGGTLRHSGNAGTVAKLQSTGAGTLYASGGTFTIIYNSGPSVISVAAGANLGDVGSYHPGGVIRIPASSGSDRVANANISAGMVISERDVEVANVGADHNGVKGRLVMRTAALFNNGSGGGTLNLWGGRCDIEVAGTIPLVNLHAGDLDCRKAPGSVVATAGFRSPLARVTDSWGANTFSITTETGAGNKGSYGPPPLL